MPLTLEDIDDLRKDRRNPIVVGEFPDEIRLMLGLPVALVHLSKHSLTHISSQHPDVNDFDLLLIPFAIKDGLLLRERRKPQIVLCVYQDPDSHRRFVAAIKRARNEPELWLDSFHRAKAKQTRAWLKRCDILKNHS